MKIFVTGGAGYIGSHCCKAFAERGWEVVVYDNLSNGWREFARWGELIEGDILDEAVLFEALERTRPDVVAHFAALIEVGQSVRDPSAFYRTNVAGTLGLLDAMRKAGTNRIVFSSTAAVYGPPTYTPIDEDHPQKPINPSGWSKRMVEQIFRDFDAAYGLRHVALRYFNAAGADPEGALGERHDPESHLIPLAVLSALRGDGKFRVFGSDYDTPDGTAIRDFVHVSDLAQAHCAAVEHLIKGGQSTAINLGSGGGASVMEIIETVENVTGTTMPLNLAERRAGDPSVLTASTDKAAEVLGWKAERSSIKAVVRDAADWHRRELETP